MNDDNNELVLKVLCSLRVGNPLRQQAEAVLSYPQTSIENLELVLRAFHNNSLLRSKERSVATWLLLHANWSDEQRVILSDTLTQSVDKALRANKPRSMALRWFRRGMLVSFLFLISYGYVFFPGSITSEGIVDFLLGMLIASAVLTLFSAIVSAPFSVWFDNRKLRRLRPLIEVLGPQGQSASIGALAASVVHPALSAVAIPAVASVASRLQPQDYGTLPSEAMPALCHALLKGDNPTVLVILHALKVVGDGRAIQAVEYAQHSAANPSGWVLCPATQQIVREKPHQEIEALASQLLPILHQRAIESQASSQLLRASSATGEGEHTLLRAANGISVTAPSELLRAAASEQDEQSE